MIWHWCEHCSLWFISSKTTVLRCPRCGADIYSNGARMDEVEDYL